jgi:hypothetical protein
MRREDHGKEAVRGLDAAGTVDDVDQPKIFGSDDGRFLP